MAQSQINKTYRYSNIKNITQEEEGIQETVKINGKKTNVVIGDKRDVKDQNISYFPIYDDIHNTKKDKVQYLGVYEVPLMPDKLLKEAGILDENGDEDIVDSNGEFKDPTAFIDFINVDKSSIEKEKAAAAETAREKRAEDWKKQKEAEKAAAAETAREKRAEDWKKQKQAEKAAAAETAKEKKAEVSTKKIPLGRDPDWIAQYFNDGNYRIVKVPGDGSCYFFAIARAIRSKLTEEQQKTGVIPQIVLDALHRVGGSEAEISIVAAHLPIPNIKYTEQAKSELNTIAALRIILSKLVTEHMLQSVLERFQAILGDYPARVIQESTESIKLEQQISSVMEQIRKLEESPASRQKVNTQLKLTEKLEQLFEKQIALDNGVPTSYANDRVSAAAELGVAEELLPFDNDNITTLEQYRNYILSNEFWANDWAIGQLEYLLNIKSIIFENSRWNHAINLGKVLSFNNPADDNVLLCGPVEIESYITKTSSFTPTEYILINWTGSVHFELITYDNISIFTWAQLPDDVKNLILYHCKTHNSGGSFEFIPDVKSAPEPPDRQRQSISSSSAGPSVDPPGLQELIDMGFDRRAALKALAKSKNIEDALALLLSSSGGKKTRRHKSYKHITKKKRHKVKKILQKKERKTKGRKVKSRSTKKKN